MKIIFLSFSDFKGGASQAAYSIFKSLNKKNSEFLTVYSKNNDTKEIFDLAKKIYIFLLRIIEKILLFFLSKKKYHQSLNLFNTFSQKQISNHKADIISFHWINRSMLSLQEVKKFKEKIAISLHDMWFLNSTEHYFEKKKSKENFLSRYCWKKKKEILYKNNTFFIAHNKWMYKKFNYLFPSLKNKIFLSEFYPINTKIFKPRNKKRLRKKYKIPKNKKIILFSAQDFKDHRKGYVYFEKVISKLSKNNDYFFISIGKSNSNLKKFENYKHFNFLTNEKTSEIYSLSDIFLCTSIIDNLPLTVLEALSSGNLVISFKNGGAEEVLKKTGYSFKTSQLNKMIDLIEILSFKQIRKHSLISRKFAIENFNKKKTKDQYLKIFKKIDKIKIN